MKGASRLSTLLLCVGWILVTSGTPVLPETERGMDRPDFEKLGEPKPGDWLFHFHESGQSLEDYVQSDPVTTSKQRAVLVFQPVGPLSDAEHSVISKAVLFAGIWFDLRTRVEPSVPLPENDWYRVRHFAWQDQPVRQYQTGYFLNELLPQRLPQDAVCYLAITMADLYPDEQWNFVFGQASLSDRVGVYSMVRYFPGFWGGPRHEGDDTLALRRSCKVLVHEVGHIFGLAHCITYRCTMNGSNSLTESDARPLRLCPLCLEKLEWNLGFNVTKRYERLKGFYEEHGMNEEAAWISRRLDRLGNRRGTRRAK